MKLVKKINNNFALGFDSKNEGIIVEGKGIGFIKMPCELTDYTLITRTYYGFSEKYIDLINTIPQETIDVANMVYEYFTSKIHCNVNPNLPFILADHIDFAIKRVEKNINVTMPIRYDLVQMYPVEHEVSKYALKLVRTRLNVFLPATEETGIIINLINAEEETEKSNLTAKYIDAITKIIEDELKVSIDKNSFNYARFETHVEYLFKRMNQKTLISSENKQIYNEMVEKTPKTNMCVEKIADYIEANEGDKLSEEEKLYLILHVNRLCERAIVS